MRNENQDWPPMMTYGKDVVNDHWTVWYDLEFNKFHLVGNREYLLHELILGDEHMIYIGDL